MSVQFKTHHEVITGQNGRITESLKCFDLAGAMEVAMDLYLNGECPEIIKVRSAFFAGRECKWDEGAWGSQRVNESYYLPWNQKPVVEAVAPNKGVEYWTTCPVVMHGLPMLGLEIQIESDSFCGRSHFSVVSVDLPGYVEVDGGAWSFVNLSKVGGRYA